MSTKSVSSHSINEDEAQINDAINELKLDENAPRPRLCHLKKWPDFQGYGFNLHAERAKLQQHIGKVDVNSPAEAAGLKEGDRIIEVNNVNISNENHQQVVKRIRNGLEIDGNLYPDQVVLLVLDPEADEFYKKLNIVVRHDLPNVLKLETSERIVVQNEQEEKEEEEDEEEEEKIPEFRTQSLIKNSEIEKNNRISNCSSQSNESEKAKSDELETSSNKTNSLHNSNSDLNNNQLSENSKESKNKIVKNSTNSMSSLNNSQDRSPLNQSKQSNSSSAASSPVQSQNSTLNRSSNIFPDEIFSIKTVHEMLEKAKTSSTIKRTDSIDCYDNTRPLFRNNDNRPPRPPPPSTHSYRSSTISTITQSDQLDKFLEMSAAEFKSYLKSKGRNDPRVISVDMKRKHEIFQNM